MNKRDDFLDDPALWDAFLKGDEYAFGEIARKYYKKLFTYGSKFSADRDFVKDCIQELFFEIWQRRETLGDTDFVKFYLFKSLRRKIHRESTKTSSSVLETDLELVMESDAGPTIEEHIIALENNEEKSRWVREQVLRLPKRQQEVIHLKFFEGLDNESIAQIMSISKPAVANLLFRTIRDLKANI